MIQAKSQERHERTESIRKVSRRPAAGRDSPRLNRHDPSLSCANRRRALATTAGAWQVEPRGNHRSLGRLRDVFAFRLRQTLAEDNHTIQPFDQEKWASTYQGIGAGQALGVFTSVRLWNLALVQKALPAAAGRTVTHPERGTMTFQTIVETMAGHDLNHIAQLQRIAGQNS